MSTQSAKITLSTLRPLVRSLPPSPLAGESVQLSDALEAIAEKAFASSSTPSTASASSSSMEALKVAGHQRRITQMRDSIARLKSGNALNNYPLTNSILTPANDPHYYTRFRNGVRNAEQGIARPWWKIFFDIKGKY
ncbi:hypothetical protein I203_105847 [Kwoniella mangroviensis CBS 8507]|uniref:uncharacterized protein n=1 Tax=Kwoniella mangroviensis CBS 8507 TaxID=1296122 RepID=UPI00080CC069|nr:uncharacterized protein I203_01658 [Kwoniella mangroviensis CBS 8507]OCF69794.1 hypothetical protein I203_01658 [Kwoniella mangroviensis CBS 8507]